MGTSRSIACSCQRARVGRDGDPQPVAQGPEGGRHEVAEGLAGAGGGVDQEQLAVAEASGDAAGHGVLALAVGGVGTGQVRQVLLEDLVHAAAVVGRQGGRLVGLHREDLGVDGVAFVVARPAGLGGLEGVLERPVGPQRVADAAVAQGRVLGEQVVALAAPVGGVLEQAQQEGQLAGRLRRPACAAPPRSRGGGRAPGPPGCARRRRARARPGPPGPSAGPRGRSPGGRAGGRDRSAPGAGAGWGAPRPPRPGVRAGTARPSRPGPPDGIRGLRPPPRPPGPVARPRRTSGRPRSRCGRAGTRPARPPPGRPGRRPRACGPRRRTRGPSGPEAAGSSDPADGAHQRSKLSQPPLLGVPPQGRQAERSVGGRAGAGGPQDGEGERPQLAHRLPGGPHRRGGGGRDRQIRGRADHHGRG